MKKCNKLKHLTQANFVNISHFSTLPYLLLDLTTTKDFEPFTCYTYLETSESLLFNGEIRTNVVSIEHVKIQIGTEKAVCHNFGCPKKYLTKLVKTQTLNL